ncbi:hypothetical protein PCASD_09811 [Puccinia coronata f. sp. avenae]|uniref:HAT C-terminal dimerisation domain-containing protein n=1 Tax=Puccinia coronata f. sp. avenae TaxID=200324 RepID=A0A2N5TCZ2_9BASI|nr:hypothetical protein PCASD_11900 [Puccinia coronata f. sp. avenae]PLW34485.1 hypothetical protein PCASD_09811 [Puccinia coronata f. sp. avenae]
MGSDYPLIKVAVKKFPNSEVMVIPNPPSNNSTLIMAPLASRTQEQSTPQEDEVGTYLKAKLSIFKVNEINSNNTPLKWWKANMN